MIHTHPVDQEVGLWIPHENIITKTDLFLQNIRNQRGKRKSINTPLIGPVVHLYLIPNQRELKNPLKDNQNHLYLKEEGERDPQVIAETALCHHIEEEEIHLHQIQVNDPPQERRLIIKVHYHHTSQIGVGKNLTKPKTNLHRVLQREVKIQCQRNEIREKNLLTFLKSLDLRYLLK